MSEFSRLDLFDEVNVRCHTHRHKFSAKMDMGVSNGSFPPADQMQFWRAVLRFHLVSCPVTFQNFRFFDSRCKRNRGPVHAT